MNVYLSPNGGDMLPGDMVIRWVLRSDLAPVPRSVEMTVYVKNGIEDRLRVGSRFWTGRELLEYEVVKVARNQASGVVQGKDQLAAFTVTALLASCVRVSFRRDRPVIRERASLGDIYRACGATAAIGDDFTVARFSCFTGQVPSFYIAQALQEEGAVLVFRDNRVSTKRLADLLRQDPVDVIQQADSSDRIESEYLERHEIPNFYSLDDAGQFVFGDYAVTRSIRFLPMTDERSLINSSRVLVTRRVVDSHMAQQINAGDIIQVNSDKLVVITAAHVAEANNGITETSSKFWLGSISS